MAVVSGTLDDTGRSDTLVVRGPFNAILTGIWTGTVKLERSFDGTNWHVLSKDVDGTEAAYEANCAIRVDECEFCLYSWNVTSLDSGEVEYRLSQ